MFQGSFRGLSRAIQSVLRVFERKIQKFFKAVSSELQEGNKEAPGCFKVLSRMFQRNLKEVL